MAAVEDNDPYGYRRAYGAHQESYNRDYAETAASLPARARDELIRLGLCPECGHLHLDAGGGYACNQADCMCVSRWFWRVKHRADQVARESLWQHVRRLLRRRAATVKRTF